jgi:two-component system NtrC family sensor kinase
MRSLGAKLIAGLSLSLAGVLVWLGFANLHTLRDNLEATAVVSAKQMADVIFRSARNSMLLNDRGELINVIQNIAAQRGVQKIRVFAKTGAIQYSTVPGETGHQVDMRSDACYACHSTSKPFEKPATKNTYRFYRIGGARVIGLIRPIENEAACSNAACHAHPASQRILGVLDVVLSLESVDEILAQHESRLQKQVIFSALLMMGIAGLLVWTLISRPIRQLISGVRLLAAGNLSHRFRFKRRDEIGALAKAFDDMAGELDTANRTLEERIERKTRELEAAQEKLIHSEKLASLGQLSASVAHEINNPLAGILTYARLLEKRLAPEKPVAEWIKTIQLESKRCGEIVNNLLVFARKQHTEMAPADVKTMVQRTIAVVHHKLEMQSIKLEVEIGELPSVFCDASQIQQVMLAIIMNAVDAMTAGGGNPGRLRVRAAAVGEGRIDIAITNNGPPILKEVLPHIFEPFFSTKKAASGVGLGLAVAYGIVKRHGGDIQVDTEEETTFHVLLPVEQETPAQGMEDNDARREILHLDRRR